MRHSPARTCLFRILVVAGCFLACNGSVASAESRSWNAYQTSVFSGSYSYRANLDLPPGTRGLAPQVALACNSFLAKNKSGWVGAGWEIPASYVQTNADGSFSLILDGARHELVYVPGDGRYHTKTETFLKIEKRNAATNEKGEYWIITDRDGTEFRFGGTLDAEHMVNDSAVTAYVWRWSLDRIRDTNGNCVYYSYAENPTANDQGAVYLSKIEYNNDRKRLVEFVLEDTDRPDISLSVEDGSQVQLARRLGEIKVCVDAQIQMVNGEPVCAQFAKRIRLGYILNAAANSSLLSSITKYGSDGVTSLPPETFTYTPHDDGTVTDLLTGITSALGEHTTIGYSLSSSFPNTNFPENYWTVTSLAGDNGMTGAHALAFTSHLTYENGYFDAATQEFRGYGKVTGTRPDGTKVTHVFRQDDGLKGREQSSLVTDASKGQGAGLSSRGTVSRVVALQATVELFFEAIALTNLRPARRITLISSQNTTQGASREQDGSRGAKGKSYERFGICEVTAARKSSGSNSTSFSPTPADLLVW